MNEPNNSEIACLREQIAREYQASQRVFTDFTPTARHEYITKRQENIAGHVTELTKYMSFPEALRIVTQVDNEVHGLPSSVRELLVEFAYLDLESCCYPV